MANFLSKMLGTGKKNDVPESHKPSLSFPIGEGWDDIEVSGEQYYREGIEKVFRSLGLTQGGVTMQTAFLVPEPKNKYDRNAVRVMICGELVGYVPQEASALVAKACRSVGAGNSATVLSRVWARNDDNIWRSRVILSFSGASENEKDYSIEDEESD